MESVTRDEMRGEWELGVQCVGEEFPGQPEWGPEPETRILLGKCDPGQRR